MCQISPPSSTSSSASQRLRVHVNWGWYGIENGFFDIALLNPVQYTYDDWQAMYIGLYPNRETLVGDVDQDGVIAIADATELIDFIMNS